METLGFRLDCASELCSRVHCGPMSQPAPQNSAGLSLPPSVLKNLGDKLYDKRKVAALDIEQMVRKLLVSKQRSDISYLIQKLSRDFARSPHSNQRKGALLGLAAVACGLTNQHINEFLPQMMPPVLESITDQDTRVRFYAVESLYNIADIARDSMVPFLLQAFDGLFRVSADADDHLRYAVPFVENLLKDIACNSPELDVSSFVSQVAVRMESIKPYNRRFILGWIEALASSTMVDLLVFLPDLLDGIFTMLSDTVSVLVLRADGGSHQHHHQAHHQMGPDGSTPLLLQKQGSAASSVSLGGQAGPRNSASSSNNVDWQPQEVRNMASDVLSQLLGNIRDARGDGDVNYAALVEHVLVPRAKDSEPRICITALEWLQAFIRLAALEVSLEDAEEGAALVRMQLLPQLHAILDALLHCIRGGGGAGGDERPRELADSITNDLFKLKDKQSWANISIEDMLGTVIRGLEDPDEATRLMALRWINFLLHIDQSEVLPQVDQLLPTLFNVMVGSSDQVVLESLTVQASFAVSSETHFKQYILRLVAGFQAPQGAQLLQRRGSMVLRRLCVLLEPERLFVELAERLEEQPNFKYAATMVQALNLILLTAPEAKELRQMLQGCRASAAGRRLFLVLYRSWCHAPGAVLTLCLLAQAYDHAAALVNTFGESAWDIDVLVQLDRVVRLLESPVFTFLRLHLLQPTVHPALMRALYGLLMILPQGEAFKTLSARLNALPMTALMQLGGGTGNSSNSSNNNSSSPSSGWSGAASEAHHPARDRRSSNSSSSAAATAAEIDFGALLSHFLELQAKHVAAEQLRQAEADMLLRHQTG